MHRRFWGRLIKVSTDDSTTSVALSGMMINPVCSNCANSIAFGGASCRHCGHALVSAKSSAHLRKVETVDTISQYLMDTEFVFHAWLASLIALVAMIFVYRIYGILDVLLITGLLVAYIWVFLLVKLDQLASAVGKNPAFCVYSSLLLPLLGNFMSFYFLRQSAQLKINQLQ